MTFVTSKDMSSERPIFAIELHDQMSIKINKWNTDQSALRIGKIPAFGRLYTRGRIIRLDELGQKIRYIYSSGYSSLV